MRREGFELSISRPRVVYQTGENGERLEPIEDVVIDVDDEYVVDTGHIVAYEDTLSFSMSKASESLLGSLLGGEGLVCRFKGRGRIYCQSHNPPSFGAALGSKLSPR